MLLSYRRPSWPVVLSVLAIVMAVPYLTPPYFVGLTYLVVMTTLLATVLHRIRHIRAARSTLFCMVFAQCALMVLGVDLTISGADRAGTLGLVGVGFACAGYVASSFCLLRARRPLHWRDGLLDAGAALVAVSALQWQWSRGGSETAEAIAKFMLPLAAVILMAAVTTVLWRLLYDNRIDKVVIQLVTAASVLMTVSVLVTQSYSDPGAPLWGFGLGYWAGVLLVVAMLHPGWPNMFDEEIDYGKRMSVMRWLGPALALMVTPGIMFALLARNEPPSLPVAFAAVVLTVVVLWRIGRLLQERESGRRELTLSEQRFRSLVQYSADVILVVDDDMRFVSVSGGVEELSGHSSEELLGMSATDLFEAMEIAAMRKAFTAAADVVGCSAIIGTDVKLRHKAEATRWVSVRATNHRQNRAVGGWVLNIHDVTERKEAEAALSRLALHDALTGLPNRTLMRDRMDVLTEKADRVMALLFCDLDGFKAVNDDLGHEYGDEVLRTVAGRWSSQLRPNDVLGRWGGDEFIVLCPDVRTVDEAAAIADRLLASLEEPLVIAGRRVEIGSSIGIALSSPDEEIDALIGRADSAMYAAKRTSGGVRLA